jgi:hypothetical protein
MPISTVRTKGEKWVKLLRAYAPVADNEAMQAEHVDKLAGFLGVPKLIFEHPAQKLLLVHRCIQKCGFDWNGWRRQNFPLL